MRIIRTLVVLILLFMPITPQIALAADAVSADSNETQTKFEINDNLMIDSGVVKDRMLASAPYNFEGYVPVKTPREIAMEKVFAKYEEKRRNADLPEGEFTINASAYTAAADECGKSDGITASGLVVQEEETLACPPQFPFGTKIDIEGVGTRICEDRGGAIKGNHIDIYVKTKHEAFGFGRQHLSAKIVM